MAAVNAAVAINSEQDLKEYLIHKLRNRNMDRASRVFKQQAGSDYGTIEQDDDYGTIEQDGDYGTIEQDGDYGTIEQDDDYGTIEQDDDYFDAEDVAKVMAKQLSGMPQKAKAQFIHHIASFFKRLFG